MLYYVTPSGDCPLQGFLSGLTGRHHEDAVALLAMLRQHGNALRPPHSKLVESHLWELRGHQVRIFYTFLPGRRIVGLDGIIKKQDEIRASDLKRVRRYLRDLLERGEEGGRG
jgi:hypothetical protein